MIMEIEMKVVSIEIIKPSSPTPKPLRKHRLSCLDQSAPPVSMPLIYLLPSNPKIPNSDKSKSLKESLSAVLSIFYPLAGTLVGNHYVDCNDTGALFFEAEVSCHLSQVIRNHDVLEKFLPFKAEESHAFCLAVQTTYFRCGGVALGILMSHKIGDGLSTFMFAKAWAAASANGGDCSGLPLPKFDTTAYFPPLQDTSGIHPAGSIWKEDDVVARNFTLPAATISLLRESYSGGGQRPSRVEAVSAFIWTQFLSATGKIPKLTHDVNVRSRVDPPLSENHFGNMVGISTAVPAAEDGGVEVVRKIREGIKGVKSGLVASTNICEQLSNDKLMEIYISSLCGFGMYEADFGWGRPVWAGFAHLPFKNAVLLMDTEEGGGGIEAHIQFTKQDMLKFQAYFNLPLITSNL